jgi:hypothetical protein
LLFEVQYAPADATEIPRVERALIAAGPRLSRWGEFRHGVFIKLLPDHDALEAAVDRRGYPWLRGWAFGDQVLLESPRAWAADDAELAELLAHELTHALMYQLLSPDDAVAAVEPPLWFREGMASVSAGQDHRRLSRDEVARFIAAHPGADLLRPSSGIYREERDAVYGAAHRAFELLLRISGDAAVRDVLGGVRMGDSFADSFARATGWPLADFEAEAVRCRFDLAGSRFAAQGAGGR